jgi:PAS domain S-box-containing protein
MLVFVGLFAWGMLSDRVPFDAKFAIPFIPGIIAAITLITTVVFYFKAPPNKLAPCLFVSYILALATITATTILTGGTGSPYLGLFAIVLSFGGFFMTGGVLVTMAALATFIGYAFIVLQTTPPVIISSGVLLLIPTLGGYILWTRLETRDNAATTEDRAYNELASELSEVAGKSEVVINAITDGVIALNGQGIIQLINPAAQQLLGWPKHDAINLSYKSILKMLDTKTQPVTDANDPVAQAIAANKTIKNDSFSLETQAGKTFLASVSVSPVGQLGNGVIIVFRDITTEKSDERQRAEFISTASHEMRTPVASIEGYLGLALNPATATIDEKARDFITKAHESAQHLGRLFADLLDVSKADDSRLKNDPKVVDIVPFVHDIVEGLTPKATEKDLRVLYKPMPSGDGTVNNTRINPVFYANVDNDHLREIVQNLVENAIKYTLKGDVVVDVTGDNEHVVISIADTGIGIPREDQAHLFQKFYRVDTSDTREIGGTGLGLYLCRRLTETIGGRIWVESEYKRGSTFYVELPRTSHDDAMHLIEQASLLAEQRAESEAQQAVVAPSVVDMSTAPVAVVAPIVATPPQAQVPVAAVAVQVTPTPTALPIPATATAIISPQPVVVPIQPPIAAPVATMQAVVPQTAVPVPRPRTTQVNTPLSAIEANPSQYVTQRPQALDVVVPSRPPR